jgi:sterol desaturase/sphingolipid hydroxylase (fatty acid hydroxylase superfamily)
MRVLNETKADQDHHALRRGERLQRAPTGRVNCTTPWQFRFLLYIATVVFVALVVVWFVEKIMGRAILPRIKQVGAVVIVLLILVFALENFPWDQF